MAKLSTHVLDTLSGRPAAAMSVRLDRRLAEKDAWTAVLHTQTNADGRTDRPLLEGDVIPTGRYRLVFGVSDYFRRLGQVLPDPPFLEEVSLEFGLSEAQGSYHVPLVCTPWSYSTYRGS
jgi:5-hydroxyisourate hydrolase